VIVGACVEAGDTAQPACLAAAFCAEAGPIAFARPKSSTLMPATQKPVWRYGTSWPSLMRGGASSTAGVGSWPADRQRMADGERVEADPDFLDDESNDLLARADVERVRSHAQRGPEIGQRFAEAQIARLVGGGELERLTLRREDLLLLPERRHPVP